MRLIQFYFLAILLFCFQQLNSQVSMETTEFFFNSNDTVLTQYSQKKLDLFIEKATNSPFYITKLRVFSDTIGPSDYNRALSERRANAIRRQLGQLAEQSYTEIAIFGKNYDSIKYPLGDLQMWRRLEVTYQREKPVIIQVKDTDNSSELFVEDTTYTEVPLESIAKEYEKPIKYNTFDTLTAEVVNQTIQLDIQFMQNSDHLYGSSYMEIKSLAIFLHKYPDLKIHIRGHVCCGPNMKMSKKRAKKVYKSLIEAGISKKRMTFKGYSNKQPIIPEEITEKDRQSNRRVDVIFSKNN